MAKRTFNVMNQTVAIEDYRFPYQAARQEQRAEALGAERIYVMYGKHVGHPPLYVQRAISNAGYTYERIGAVTYSHIVFALIKTVEGDKHV